MKYYRFLLTGLILISGLFSNSKEYVLTQTKIDNPISYVQYNPDDYPDRTRQGGDTYDDATEIESLPFSITGTTSLKSSLNILLRKTSLQKKTSENFSVFLLKKKFRKFGFVK